MSALALLARVDRARRRIDGLADLLLIARMMLWACGLRVLKHVVPLPRLVRLAHQPLREWAGMTAADTARPRQAEDKIVERIVRLARWSCSVLQPADRGNCLERGLVTYRYLVVAGEAPTLMIGAAHDAGGPIRGHAWVSLAGRTIDETPESLAGFECMVAFGPDGRMVK